MHRMKEFMEKLEEAAKCQFDKGIHCVDTEEMGKVIDMIKDCAMTMYYYTVYEEMKEEEEWERKGYNPYRYASGRFAPKGRGRRMGFEEPPYWHMMPEHEKAEWMLDRDMDMDMGRMYTGTKPSRYGYSHDEYIREKQAHPGMDDSSKQMRMNKLNKYLDDLTEMAKETVVGMSPEEKQSWKVTLNKLINM